MCFEMCTLYNAEEMLKNAAKKQWFYVNSAQHCSRVLSLELVETFFSIFIHIAISTLLVWGEKLQTLGSLAFQKHIKFLEEPKDLSEPLFIERGRPIV